MARDDDAVAEEAGLERRPCRPDQAEPFVDAAADLLRQTAADEPRRAQARLDAVEQLREGAVVPLGRLDRKSRRFKQRSDAFERSRTREARARGSACAESHGCHGC